MPAAGEEREAFSCVCKEERGRAHFFPRSVAAKRKRKAKTPLIHPSLRPRPLRLNTNGKAIYRKREAAQTRRKMPSSPASAAPQFNSGSGGALYNTSLPTPYTGCNIFGGVPYNLVVPYKTFLIKEFHRPPGPPAGFPSSEYTTICNSSPPMPAGERCGGGGSKIDFLLTFSAFPNIPPTTPVRMNN